ncbi:MAG: zf-TFIIB domain-containing protein [Planctomycetota bacterium]|nr:zf-TFIIB domain-containing protein [Planctomycetota bacterium]
MNCPKCGTKLAKVIVDGVLADRCATCEGIWLDAGELDNLIRKEKKSKDELLAEAKRELCEVAAICIVGTCPRCQGKLEQFIERPAMVKLDSCRSCKGIWFDYGELEKIRKNPPAGGIAKFFEYISSLLG